MHRLLAAALVVACAPAAPPAPSPPAVTAAAAPVAVPTAETSPQAANDAGADAGATPDAATAPPPLGSTPEHFRCGEGKCKAGSETCCGASNRGVCVPSSAYDAPQGKVGYLKTQWEVCDKAAFEKTGYSMSHIDRCDESADCGKGEACCEQFLFSGGTLSECTKLPAGGATPCDFGERCIESATCRLPGSECIQGYCRKPVPNLACGDTTCSGTTPVCCGDPAGCRSSCESYKRVRCSKNADCLKGQRCAVASGGSDCITLIQDRESQQVVCKLDGDCNFQCGGGRRPRCKTSDIPWIKSCQCS